MRSLDLVGIRRWFFLVSGAIVVASLVLLAIPPTLRPGIEFTAGTTTLMRFDRPVDQAQLREAYADLDHPEARLQSTGEREYLIRTSRLHVPDSALIEVNPQAPPDAEQPTAEIGTVLLGAEGAGGEIPIRVFDFAVCDFRAEPEDPDDRESFPAGTEAVVFAEIRDCGDAGATGITVVPDDDDTRSRGGAGADRHPRRRDGRGTLGRRRLGRRRRDPRLPRPGGRARRPDGFIAPADTHGFRAPGEAAPAPEGSAADLGERGVIEAALEARFGSFEVLEFASVSAVVSTQAVRNATVAVVVATLFIMAYIMFAFSSVPKPMRYASAAMIALAHDTIIVLGAFSLFGKVFGTEINLMFVTGVLTIIGFSVHDTIVIFDRVRENVRLAPTARFADNVNAALVQTLARSLNTSITLLFTILALLWLGGSTIQAFLIVLLVGVVAGAYSSIAIAAQVLVAWEEGDVPRLLGRFRRGPTGDEEATAT